jgi:hypothetical protein
MCAHATAFTKQRQAFCPKHKQCLGIPSTERIPPHHTAPLLLLLLLLQMLPAQHNLLQLPLFLGIVLLPPPLQLLSDA